MNAYRLNRNFYQEKGFSLVELAMVLTVIGLLIGGVIKGQELVANARAARVITEVKQHGQAIQAFQDLYNDLPGDIRDPSARIPDCTSTPCGITGNGNRVIGTVYHSGTGNVSSHKQAANNTTDERRGVWLQLSRAGLINSVKNDYVDSASLAKAVPGMDYPQTAWPGIGLGVYFWKDANWSSLTAIPQVIPGHYINTKTVPLRTAQQKPLLSAKIVAHMDAKVDDGRPLTGRVLALESTNAPCYSVNNAYLTGDNNAFCEISFRMDF